MKKIMLSVLILAGFSAEPAFAQEGCSRCNRVIVGHLTEIEANTGATKDNTAAIRQELVQLRTQIAALTTAVQNPPVRIAPIHFTDFPASDIAGYSAFCEGLGYNGYTTFEQTGNRVRLVCVNR